MDQETQKRLDSMLEDEMRLGYRVKDVPEHLSALLAANGGPTISRVRFTRLNPSRRRKIAEVVQKQYHRDLKDPSILSHEQLRELVEQRGEWSVVLDEEMKTLQSSTSRAMGELYAHGLLNDEWGLEMMRLTALFRAKLETLLENVDQRRELQEMFDRWAEYQTEHAAEYTTKYAADQGRAEYSPDVDQQQLLIAVGNDTELVDVVYKVEELRDRLYSFLKLQKDRLRLAELQLKHIKIFSESVEQRRDVTEEMARLYFTAERVDEAGAPQGPLATTFETVWDFPEETVQWFLLEAYFFQNGIPDQAREYLETFGFLKADPANETNPSSIGDSAPFDGLLDPQTSSSATAVLEGTAVASSEPSVATTSTMVSSP